MDNSENLLSNELQVDTEGQAHLYQTAKWAKFLGVMGFIFTGLMLIIALGTVANYGNSGSRDYAYSSRSAVASPGFTIFFLLGAAAVWFIASLYTYRFATKMKTALQNTDQLAFNDSLGNLSKNYKFLGIVTIVYIALMILAFLAFIFLLSFRRY